VDEPQELRQRLGAYRTLHRTIQELNTNAARDLGATLQAVVDGVVESLGFQVAAVNLASEHRLEVAAIAGPDEVKNELKGQVGSRAAWEELLSSAEEWGALRYFSLHHANLGDVPVWTPEAGASADDPEAWHPEDVLVAPLYESEGKLVGVLSVDLPRDGKKPGPLQRELLEMFAAQAAIAIENARLHAALVQSLEQVRREQQALKASEESFRLAFENAPSGMAMRSLRRHDRGVLMRVNAALSHLLGYSTAELTKLGLQAVIHPDDRTMLSDDADLGRVELRMRRNDGTHLWVSANSSIVHGVEGYPEFQLIHVHDVSERRARELKLAHRAAHDPLTGLPNRSELRTRLYAMLGSSVPVVVLFCDLDDFKKVNDTYGHDAGDAVLIEIGQRLRMHVRENDTVARLGGDEFVIVLRDLDPPDAHDLVTRLAEAVSRPVHYEGHVITVSASIGLGASAPASTVDELLREADKAMYRAKGDRSRPIAIQHDPRTSRTLAR
jgi:diguanylate cyclase (GGDEF)-like protein/PAS domain S-box-containing protein